jgi:hypothetical protein
VEVTVLVYFKYSIVNRYMLPPVGKDSTYKTERGVGMEYGNFDHLNIEKVKVTFELGGETFTKEYGSVLAVMAVDREAEHQETFIGGQLNGPAIETMITTVLATAGQVLMTRFDCDMSDLVEILSTSCSKAVIRSADGSLKPDEQNK